MYQLDIRPRYVWSRSTEWRRHRGRNRWLGLRVFIPAAFTHVAVDFWVMRRLTRVCHTALCDGYFVTFYGGTPNRCFFSLSKPECEARERRVNSVKPGRRSRRLFMQFTARMLTEREYNHSVVECKTKTASAHSETPTNDVVTSSRLHTKTILGSVWAQVSIPNSLYKLFAKKSSHFQPMQGPLLTRNAWLSQAYIPPRTNTPAKLRGYWTNVHLIVINQSFYFRLHGP